MFLDRFHHTLDSKNRVSVPKKIIEAITDTEQRKEFIVTPGIEDDCLLMFTENGFKELSASIKSQWLGNDENRLFERHFFGGASRVALDSAGRMLIPERQRESAEIVKDVTFVGCNDRIEIWATDNWNRVNEKARSGFLKASRSMVQKDQD